MRTHAAPGHPGDLNRPIRSAGGRPSRAAPLPGLGLPLPRAAFWILTTPLEHPQTLSPAQTPPPRVSSTLPQSGGLSRELAHPLTTGNQARLPPPLRPGCLDWTLPSRPPPPVQPHRLPARPPCFLFSKLSCGHLVGFLELWRQCGVSHEVPRRLFRSALFPTCIQACFATLPMDSVSLSPRASPRPGTWGAVLRKEEGSARASYRPAPAVDQTRGRRPAGEQQDPSLRLA